MATEKEILDAGVAAGIPEAVKLRAWANASRALDAAKLALAAAEGKHRGRIYDLKLAAVSAEQIAAPHVAVLANAKDALATAEADAAAELNTLREAVAAAEAAEASALKK